MPGDCKRAAGSAARIDRKMRECAQLSQGGAHRSAAAHGTGAVGGSARTVGAPLIVRTVRTRE